VERQLPTAYAPGRKSLIRIQAAISSNLATYQVEDQPPVNWTVTNVNEGGTYDAISKKVKFGPFLDKAPRTLTYEITPPAGETGTKTFTGVASVDGVSLPVLGNAMVQAPVRLKKLILLSNNEFDLDLEGCEGNELRIEVSTNLIDWALLTVKTNQLGRIRFLDPEAPQHPKRFYRIAVP